LPHGKAIAACLLDYAPARLYNTAPTWMVATNAMAHGALNIKTRDWHHDVLARAHLDGLAWPQVRPAGSVVATLKVGTGSIPCYTPVGDFQASLTGAFLQDSELSLDISTG
jgi:glycerol kinase